MIKLLNLVYCFKDGKVLLAKKKRGFGVGWWNGYGGKVQEGESVEEAARREVKEESGITIEELKSRGVLSFTFEDKPDSILEVHIFEAVKYNGEPVETEEMKPQWFEFNEIPFDKMWPSDKYWLPQFLEGNDVEGSAHFDKDKNILNHTLSSIKKAE